MSPESIELFDRSKVARAQTAELHGVMEQRLRTMRSLHEDLRTTRGLAATIRERAEHNREAHRNRPDS
jgi:hypothetical protein